MSFFETLNISATGLTSQRMRMDIISENIANVNTTRTGNGKPYKRQTVLFEQNKGVTPFDTHLNDILNIPVKGRGVRVSKVATDTSMGAKVYEPNHPDADKEGYVEMPNVNIVNEMVNMISASRSYEANVTAMNTTKTMMSKTLEIAR